MRSSRKWEVPQGPFSTRTGSQSPTAVLNGPSGADTEQHAADFGRARSRRKGRGLVVSARAGAAEGRPSEEEGQRSTTATTAPGFTRHSFLAGTEGTTVTNVAAAPSPPLSPRPSRRRGHHSQTARTPAVSPAHTAARRLVRKNPLAVCLTVVSIAVAVLLAILALAAYGGLWPWRDLFPYRGELFQPDRDCRRVSTGAEVACGSPWSARCFDRTRCRGGGGGGGGVGRSGRRRARAVRGRGGSTRGAGGGDLLSVYVHDETCSMRKSSEIMASYRGVAVPLMWNEAAKALRYVAAKRDLLVDTPDEACIVFYAVPERGECVSKTPTWGGGQNHVLLDLNDQSREARRSLDVKAMFVQSNMRPCYYRHGYDVAVPLRARKLFHSLRKIAPRDRKYFATFKGSLYLTGNGMLERSAVLNLRGGGASAAAAAAAAAGALDRAAGASGGGGGSASSSDVVVVERCHHLHHEQLLSWNKGLCDASEREFDSVSYEDLMNTTFALLPAGRSPATYRLAEALSAGALPVFIHQDFVKPFPGQIPWSEFSFSFPPEEAPRILETLRAVPDKKLAQMQVTALEVFDTYFGPGMGNTLHTVLDILEDRLHFRARRRGRRR